MRNNVILLVEDDPDDEQLALSALRQLPAGRVVTVRDGTEALDYLRSRPGASLPRVILLDLKLPGLDGCEVLRRIRADPRTALIPVVVMTTSGETRDRLSSYQNGANSYVRKPIDFEQFRNAIRQLSAYWLGLNETVGS